MAQQNRRYVIDATPDLAVVRCTRCEWRGTSHARSSAYRQIAAHMVTAHNDGKAAYDARALAKRAPVSKLDSASVRTRGTESAS